MIHAHSIEDHQRHRLLTGLALGGIAVGAAVIVAPHILPAIGFGSAHMAAESMFVLHAGMNAGGTGLAGIAHRALLAVPWVGHHLASGGLLSAATSATIGIGGVLLGNALERRNDGSMHIHWGKIIKYAALATSALIALPTTLTALSVGLIYLSTLTKNVHIANSMIRAVEKTLGAAGNMQHSLMGLSGGLATLTSHILTCGVSLLPATLALTLDDTSAAQRYSDGSIAADISLNEPTRANEPCTGLLKLTHTKNHQPITAQELAEVHTKKLHMFIVDSSLKDYQHLHPEPTDTPGTYVFRFTPRTGNRYSAWSDFTLESNEKNHRLKTTMQSAQRREVAPRITHSDTAIQNGIHCKWQMNEKLQENQSALVDVQLSDTNGRPVTDLEPVMGAFAHLVGFSADGKSLIHCHPLGKEPTSMSERGGPDLRFHIEPDCSGPVQFYLQVKRRGQDVFIPFGQQIAGAIDKAPAPRSSHAGHSLG